MYRITKLIPFIFHPVHIFSYFTYFTFELSVRESLEIWFSSALVPFLWIYLVTAWRKNTLLLSIDTLRFKRREERPVVLLLILISYSLLCVFFYEGRLEQACWCIVLNVLVAFCFSYFIKVSLHSMAIFAATSTYYFYTGTLCSFAVLLCLVVVAERIYSKSHTYMEVFFGIIIGIISTTTFFLMGGIV